MKPNSAEPNQTKRAVNLVSILLAMVFLPKK